jgi:hypothetical protein
MTMTCAFSSGSLHHCLLCHKPTRALPHRVFKMPVCPTCLVRHGPAEANQSERGEPDGLPMFSVEFEVRSEIPRESERALVLLASGYLRTYDCTVDDEYKSPRYRSLAAFRQVLPVLDQLGDLVDPLHCGTHLHIDCPARDLVGAQRWTLFGPLMDYLYAHPQETAAFWGRSSGHALVIPSVHYRTLEFRKPCFRSSAQYLAVVTFCRRIGRYLDDCLNPASPTPRSRPPEWMSADILALYRQALASSSARQEKPVAV